MSQFQDPTRDPSSRPQARRAERKISRRDVDQHPRCHRRWRHVARGRESDGARFEQARARHRARCDAHDRHRGDGHRAHAAGRVLRRAARCGSQRALARARDAKPRSALPAVIVTGRVVAQQQVAPLSGQTSFELDKPLPQARVAQTVPAVQTAQTRTATTTMSEHDRLAQEARMVSEARGALHRGEPETALSNRSQRRARAGRRTSRSRGAHGGGAGPPRDGRRSWGAARLRPILAGKFPEQANLALR